MILISLYITFVFSLSSVINDEEIFMDYCNPALCKGDTEHTGCPNGVIHNGELQKPPCSEDAIVIELSDSDKQDILDFHNIQRNYVACGGLFKDYKIKAGCRHGVVSWDKELEKTAFLHASNCIFEHDKCRNTLKYPYSGQNIGIHYSKKMLGSNTAYINLVSYFWYTEYKLVDNAGILDAYFHKKDVGHFVALMNEKNNLVGCVMVKYLHKEKQKPAVMLTCNYPMTNAGRKATYNSCKVPGSRCTTGTDQKYKFLCSSEEKYDVSSGLAFIEYDGDGSEIFENCGPQVESIHLDREGADAIYRATSIQKPLNTTTLTTTTKPNVVTKPEETAAAKPTDQVSPSYNLEALGTPDYTEDEYDPPSSCSRKLWQPHTYSNVYLVVSISCLTAIITIKHSL